MTIWLGFLLLLAWPRPSWADACDQLPRPSVTLKRIDERATVSAQYGYRELTHLGSALAPAGKQVLGLTRGKAIAQVAITTPVYVDPFGRWECASPQITVSLGFRPITVYVAKEFPAGGCAYDAIYRHELRHVETYQAQLAAIEKDVAETLGRRFASGAPWRGPVGQAQARLQQELDERWLPYMQRELARADGAQALIDTAEEYARVTNSCDGEIRRRIQEGGR